MNAGSNLKKAIEQTKANAKQTNKVKYLIRYNGRYWIDNKPPGIQYSGNYKQVLPNGLVVEYNQ